MVESLQTTAWEILLRLLIADRFPDPVRELKQENHTADGHEAGYWKTKSQGMK